MANFARIPICPYFRDEKNKSISCEDTFRSFPTTRAKQSWIEIYCTTWYWMHCPHAAEITGAYERGDHAVEEQSISAMNKELKRLATRLGRSQKRVERQQKKIDELREVNQSYMRANESLEKQKKHYYDLWRQTQDLLDRYERKVADQMTGITQVYEQRMAYLIDSYVPGGVLLEQDVRDWAGDKSFAIVADYTEMEQLAWRVKFDEKETDDGERVQRDGSEAAEDEEEV